MVGRIADITRISGQGWRNPGDLIYLLGTALPVLGGSEYLAALHQIVAGQPPIVDFTLEKAVQAACRQGIAQGWVQSAHDCAEGGLAVALAESAIAGNLGAAVTIPAARERLDAVLFGEAASRIVVSVKAEDQFIWEAFLEKNLGKEWKWLGKVGSADENLRIAIAGQAKDQNLSENIVIDQPLELLAQSWSTAIERRLQ